MANYYTRRFPAPVNSRTSTNFRTPENDPEPPVPPPNDSGTCPETVWRKPNTWFSHLWCKMKEGITSTAEKIAGCYQKVWYQLMYMIGLSGPPDQPAGGACWALVVITLWPVIGGVVLLLYLLSGQVQTVASGFEWLTSFLTQVYSFAEQTASLVSTILSTVFGWIYSIADGVSGFTGANSALCKLLATTILIESFVHVFSDLEGAIQDWMNILDPPFYDIYHAIDSPFSWLRSEAFSFNKWAGIITTIVLVPFDMAALLISFVTGGIYYLFQRLWEKISNVASGNSGQSVLTASNTPNFDLNPNSQSISLPKYHSSCNP